MTNSIRRMPHLLPATNPLSIFSLPPFLSSLGGNHHHHHSYRFHNKSRQSQSNCSRSSLTSSSRPLLYGATTIEQHEAKITTILHVCKLYKDGYDFSNEDDIIVGRESVDCAKGEDGIHHEETEKSNVERQQQQQRISRASGGGRRARDALSSIGFEFRFHFCNECRRRRQQKQSQHQHEHQQHEHDENKHDENNHQEHSEKTNCPNCVTRLYHTPSHTLITTKNRPTFIADGIMYDEMADLIQAAAQEIMAEACDLVWVTVCDGKGGGLRSAVQRQQQQNQQLSEQSQQDQEWPRDEKGNIIIKQPIRAMVGRNHNNYHDSHQHSHDTFLVSTGKGKVRAGIFSRQHLMTTGLEPSTALPLLLEARSRGMNCVVIDPNARGDRLGMETFEVTIRGLFEHPHCCEKRCDSNHDRDHHGDDNHDFPNDENDGIHKTRDNHDLSQHNAIIPSNTKGSIYVLAHSAAGGQLVRYLMDQNQNQDNLLSRIRSITFTDSTHSIQWARNLPHLSSLLQSSQVMYVRTPNPMRDDGYEDANPGDECPPNQFWTHRFGTIRTVWAGTTEHSLANWIALRRIWQHFDSNRHHPNDENDEGQNETFVDTNLTTNTFQTQNSYERNSQEHGGKNVMNEDERKGNNAKPELQHKTSMSSNTSRPPVKPIIV